MKILIADDHALFLKGVELVLTDAFPDAELVKAQNYTEVFSAIKETKDLDLILTDLAMPGAQWFDALQQIHQILPEVPVVILSAVFDKDIVQKTIELGVGGYIPKTSSNAVILSAINLVLSGGIYIPSELLGKNAGSEVELLHQFDAEAKKETTSKKQVLSSRQIDVLKLISAGKSNKQIAYELGLTEGTVKLHVTAILKQLNVYNRTGAVAAATQMGLLNKND